jgi:hypothetical protein
MGCIDLGIIRDVSLVAFISTILAYLLVAYHLEAFHLVAYDLRAYLPFDNHKLVAIVAYLEVVARIHLIFAQYHSSQALCSS